MQDQRLEWLRPKMDHLLQVKARQEAQGKNFNTTIQAGHEYRNPRICEKLIESCNIDQYGSNLPKDQFNPNRWKGSKDAFYDSSHYRRLAERREIERRAKKPSADTTRSR